jgi:hypothetical protein
MPCGFLGGLHLRDHHEPLARWCPCPDPLHRMRNQRDLVRELLAIRLELSSGSREIETELLKQFVVRASLRMRIVTMALA